MSTCKLKQAYVLLEYKKECADKFNAELRDS